MKTRGYTKLFSEILTSSVWTEEDHVRIVWITLLALCDSDGMVRASVPGLANVARVPLSACEKALQVFTEPDTYSRSQEHDGRRIEAVDGGWKVLNFEKYREAMSLEHRREYLRRKQAEYRSARRSLEKKHPHLKPVKSIHI